MLLLRYLNVYTGISSLQSIIRSWKTDVLGENANWELTSHHFKREKMLCDGVNLKPLISQEINTNVTKL